MAGDCKIAATYLLVLSITLRFSDTTSAKITTDKRGKVAMQQLTPNKTQLNESIPSNGRLLEYCLQTFRISTEADLENLILQSIYTELEQG